MQRSRRWRCWVRTCLPRPPVPAWLAGRAAGVVLFFIPGFAGFLVWELKENWRLYAASQPATLRPEVVGSHGETVRRLLDLHHSSHMWIIDEALAKMNAELAIDLPDPQPSGKAA